MLTYLFKLLYLVVFSFVVIFVYYNSFNFHVENFDGYTPYVISMIFIYFSYKWYNYIVWKKELSFTPIWIFWLFLIHLLILSILTFTITQNWASNWITLFFKIIWYLFFPTIFVLSFLSIWKFLLEKINSFKEESTIFQFLSSLWVWFFVFLTLVTVFWFFGYYNLYAVFWVLIWIIWISYKEFISIFKGLFTYKIQIPDHDFSKDSSLISKINLNLISTEFLFIVITFLISVNFINIVRPMPIGWDDLWVYMNFPNLMSSSNSILNLWWMYSWQVFTWIWYLISWATQAFFINNIGWVLSVIVIILSLWDLLKSKSKTFLNIPFLMASIFIAMPMVVFQQAKDMKLDPGLMFVSILVLYMTFYVFLKYLWYKSQTSVWNFSISTEKNSWEEMLEVTYQKQTKNWFVSYFTSFTHIWEDVFSKKSYLIYLFIIWALAWFAFWIKFTSLLLISWIIWIIFYSKLWIAWFLSYISFYIAIFTKGWLWNMMNVVFPKDGVLVDRVFMYWIVLALLFLAYSINKYKLKTFITFGKILAIFLIWVWIWVSPWIWKNIVSSGSLSIWSILNWKWDTLNIDYTKIYSQAELDEINKANTQTSMTESWTSINEDLWRYFWYEKGINNYLKLPYNLTMQTNQRWEYTDITYIFLALLPVVLFFGFKCGFWVWAFIFTLIPFLFFFNSWINSTLTDIFSNFDLPFWYLIILLFFIVPFLYFIYSLNKDKHSVLLKLNLVFWMFYILLWSISAFGIVWYGIVMYYSILFAFSIWIYYISSYIETEELKQIFFKFFGSVIIFIIIWIYFFYSAFPHWFTNISNSWYFAFKAWMQDNYTAIIDSHPDYFNVLVELNISWDSQKQIIDEIINQVKNEKVKNILLQSNIKDLETLKNYLSELSTIKDESINQIELASINSESKKMLSKLYKIVLYPSNEIKNKEWIYRIWTFLRYFISDNYNRLLEDSLITEFNKYFYDESDINIWVDRMKKIWVNYFLVDLNAATIDKDPAHNLTTRYENLLKTFTSDKLELIQTDSICLNLALEDYNKSQKTSEDLQKYLTIAWVNYESYTENWEVINRWVKQLECYKRILDLIWTQGLVTQTDYKYLLPIVNYLNENKISSQEELVWIFQKYINHWWMVLFRIK